jgi:hypothetical protein
MRLEANACMFMQHNIYSFNKISWIDGHNTDRYTTHISTSFSGSFFLVPGRKEPGNEVYVEIPHFYLFDLLARFRWILSPTHL